MNDNARAAAYALLTTFAVLGVAGALGALTATVSQKMLALAGMIIVVLLAAYTNDWLWWARRPLWTRATIWVNPFGLSTADAPPLVWRRKIRV